MNQLADLQPGTPPGRPGISRAGHALTTAGLVAIALATLGPVVLKGPAERLPTLCLLCGDIGTVDFVLNIALFVPFGLVFSFEF